VTALQSLVSQPDNAGLFMDFDGTLSEIVSVPSDARPLPGVPELLKRLDAIFNVVAVVSGRRATELVEWLGSDVEIWGVHGAERVRRGRVVVSDRASPYLDAVAAARAEAEATVDGLDIEGVAVEDKKATVALHYRRAADVDSAEDTLQVLARELARRHGLATSSGKLVIELRPPVDLTKKAVVLERARAAGLRAVAFLGDDRVDLLAFDALDELEAQGVETLRVAVDSAEAPEELLGRADVVVDGPAGAIAWLSDLIEGHQRPARHRT
jgi:trehalose 6-phosphate phosphatase